ncbi:MAG: OadG family protein [Desulfosoma sp.]
MRGLSAIAAVDGWSLTVMGVAIVLVGLSVLSLVLANLHRILNLWDVTAQVFKEKTLLREKPVPSSGVKVPSQGPSTTPPVREMSLSREDMEAYQYFHWLSQRQGDVFSLPKLLEHAEKRGMDRPHYHLYKMLVLGLIEEMKGDQRGFYRWNPEVLVRSDENSES